jgi:hypothetical protein
LAREKGTSNLHVLDEQGMDTHDLEFLVQNTRPGVQVVAPAPWHLTQVRSLPVSATSVNSCAGVPTRNFTKYCPVPAYAPDDTGKEAADAPTSAADRRLPSRRDASLAEMYACRCRSSIARSAMDAPGAAGTSSSLTDLPLATAAAAASTRNTTRLPLNSISREKFSPNP